MGKILDHTFEVKQMQNAIYVDAKAPNSIKRNIHLW
jgi:hypothetical protein